MEGESLTMELIPVRLMNFLIGELTMNKPGKKDAAPEVLIIKQ